MLPDISQPIVMRHIIAHGNGRTTITIMITLSLLLLTIMTPTTVAATTAPTKAVTTTPPTATAITTVATTKGETFTAPPPAASPLAADQPDEWTYERIAKGALTLPTFSESQSAAKRSLCVYPRTTYPYKFRKNETTIVMVPFNTLVHLLARSQQSK
jgi:hypothetical protein